MEVPVIVEPVAGNGYRATGTAGLTFGLVAEGTTREEAVDRLRALVQARAASGAEILPLQEGDTGPHPFSKQAGWLRDDPMYDAWRQAMEDYRRQLDEDLDAP